MPKVTFSDFSECPMISMVASMIQMKFLDDESVNHRHLETHCYTIGNVWLTNPFPLIIN